MTRKRLIASPSVSAWWLEINRNFLQILAHLRLKCLKLVVIESLKLLVTKKEIITKSGGINSLFKCSDSKRIYGEKLDILSNVNLHFLGFKSSESAPDPVQ